jgi:hypothetical protein
MWGIAFKPDINETDSQTERVASRPTCIQTRQHSLDNQNLKFEHGNLNLSYPMLMYI